MFDGIKHSDVPDLKVVANGEVEIGSELLKRQARSVSNQEIVATKKDTE